MKTLTKILMIMVVLVSPLSIAAQDVSVLVVQLSEQYKKLETEVTKLNDSIKLEEDKSFNLRLSWYNTCKTYLQKGKFNAKELESLINQTIPEIDGAELYEELKRAKECFDMGKEYHYKDVPTPTRDLSAESSSDESNKKSTKDKKSNNNKNKTYPTPSNDNREPIVDNDADRKESTPVKEEPIVTDPSKDRDGEDKPTVPVVKKDSAKETPVIPDPKNSKSTKEEKKHDKGEMEEGTSKKSKNNDGSR